MDKKLTLILESLVNDDRSEAERLLHDLIVELARKINSKIEAEAVDAVDDFADIEIMGESEEFADVELDSEGEVDGEIDGEEAEDVDGEGEEEDLSLEGLDDRIDDLDAQIAALQAEIDGLSGEDAIDDIDGDEFVEGKSFRHSEDEDEFDVKANRRASADLRKGRKPTDVELEETVIDMETGDEVSEGKSFRHSDDEEEDVTAKRKAGAERRKDRKPETVEMDEDYYPELDDMDVTVDDDFDSVDLADFDFDTDFDESSDLLKKVKLPKNNGNELAGGKTIKSSSQKTPVVKAEDTKLGGEPAVIKKGGDGHKIKTTGIKRAIKGPVGNEEKPLKPVKVKK